MKRIIIAAENHIEHTRLCSVLQDAGVTLEPALGAENTLIGRTGVIETSACSTVINDIPLPPYSATNTPASSPPAANTAAYDCLHQCLQHAPAAIAVFDREMHYLAYSQHWLKDYSLGEEDLTGQCHYDIFPHTSKHWKEIHRRCLEGAIESSEADEFPRTDGSVDWIDWEVRPWFDHNGDIGGIIMLTDIITDEIETERELNSQEELLKAVEEMTHVGGWEFDVTTGKGTWTDEVARIHELDTETSPDIDFGLSFYTGESRRRIEAAVTAAAEEGRAFDLELEMTTAKDNHRWIRTMGRPVREKGKVISVTGSFQDITRIKQAEQEQYAELHRVQRQLAAVGMVAASEALLAGNLEMAARLVTEQATIVTGAQRANVWLFNEDETEMHCIDLFEATPALHSSGMFIKEEDYSNEIQVLKSSKSVAAHDPFNDPRTIGYVEDYLKPLHITSMLDTMVHASGKNFGMLCIEFVNTLHHWEQDEIIFAEQLADKLAFCLVNQQRHDAMRKLALANSVVESSDTLVYRHSAAQGWPLTYISDNVVQFGYIAYELLAEAAGFEKLLHPADRTAAVSALMKAEKDGSSQFLREYRIVTREGETRWLGDKCTVARDLDGRITHVQGVVTDITARKAAELKAARLNRLYRVTSGINTLIVRATTEAELFEESCRIATGIGNFPLTWIGLVSEDGEYLKPAAWHGPGGHLIRDIQSLPLRGADVNGPAVRAVNTQQAVYINDIDTEYDGQWKRMVLTQRYQSVASLPLLIGRKAIGVICFYATSGNFFDDEEIALLSEISGDISFALHHLSQRDRIDYLTSYDSLTGLSNRSLFLQHLGRNMDIARQSNELLALLLLDLKEFRNINSVYGRTTGDHILQESVSRLREFTANPADLARIGSDVFAFALRGLESPQEIAMLFERRISPLLNNQEFKLHDEHVRLEYIAGISLFPEDADDAETMVRNAEVALRRAKSIHAPYVFYKTEMATNIAELVALQNRLRSALDKQQFVLYYQPKVDSQTRRITGLEALLRWNDPESGLVPPDKFIPLLESSGLIHDVGLWVLSQAASDYLYWESVLPRAPRIAVNVSELQLRQPDFVKKVKKAATIDNRLVPMELEITESLIMKEIEHNIIKLKALREAGMRIAVDDFGTGYSSLSYISRLPLDCLKIDRVFINSMLTNQESGTIVETIISLAHSLRLKVIAEGVETLEQAARLQELKCEEMQGYLFSSPLPAKEIEPLLLLEVERRGAAK